MLKHLIAAILLISHINFSMFIAQVDEVDTYDTNGNRINDINSLTEYINDIVLHHRNTPRSDEDDNNARYFHLIKLTGYFFSQPVTVSGSKPADVKSKTTFPYINTQKLLSVFYDVVTPPPKS